jgi:hypothetical protein
MHLTNRVLHKASFGSLTCLFQGRNKQLTHETGTSFRKNISISTWQYIDYLILTKGKVICLVYYKLPVHASSTLSSWVKG